MANLKEIRLRITSVKSTQQVTSAMKMVSAAKLRKAQDAIIQLRPYANKLHEILTQVSENIGKGSNLNFSKRDQIDRVLLISIASNRGLCGGFNTNVIKKVSELVEHKYADLYKKEAVDIFAIGKKSIDGLNAKGLKITRSDVELYNSPSLALIGELAQSIMDAYLAGSYDEVVIVYNQFRNAAIQNIRVEQFLPVEMSKQSLSPTTKKKGIVSDYYFEPSTEEIVNAVIPKSLKIQFYKAILDSIASEHGARMTAMHKATDNAAALVKELNLKYNKARQAAITNEILEIVGGANALKG